MCWPGEADSSELPGKPLLSRRSGDIALIATNPAMADIHCAITAGAADGMIYRDLQFGGGKKGIGPICRNGPEGASHKLDLSPFSSTVPDRELGACSATCPVRPGRSVVPAPLA